MFPALLGLSVVMVALALWLGMYLLNRDPHSPRLQLAALGLISYAAALALMTLEPQFVSAGLADVRLLMMFVPAIFWTGALVYLLPDDLPFRTRLVRGWRLWQIPAVTLFGIVALWGSSTSEHSFKEMFYLVFATLVLLPLLVVWWHIWHHRGVLRPNSVFGVVLVATLFFGLSTALILFPLDVLPLGWLLPLMGIDLLVLGVAIAALDAFDLGETLLLDLIRSLVYTMLMALLFGLPVTTVMILETGPTPVMRALLVAMVVLTVAVQTLGDRAEMALDHAILARFPGLQAARADLRAAERAISRVNPTVDFNSMSNADFARLTRRALTHLRDLPRLASSPLTYLPLVDARLARRGDNSNTLSRANELRRLLTESIERLRPPGSTKLGTGDAWRHYNALYIPYVHGLKPFSHPQQKDLDSDVLNVLEWFRTQVPERTLHNWQNAAAKLIAQDLREQMSISTRHDETKMLEP